MPTYNRRSLRQKLGQVYLRDTLVGNTSGSWGATASLTVYDVTRADLTLSGEAMYQRSVMRLLTTSGYYQDARVATFNVGSGAFMCLVTGATTTMSGASYELHQLLPPDDKDRALTEAVARLRVQQEVPIDSVEDLHIYSLGPEVLDVFDVRYLTYPTASRESGTLSWWKVVTTATGQEIQIHPTLERSCQLLVNAIVAATLGAADTATINLPVEEWLLTGAAQSAYWMLEAKAPGQEASVWQDRRREMARAYNRLSARFQPVVSRKIQLDTWM